MAEYTLNPINPLLYITPHDPVPEKVQKVSKWFKDETVELTFGKEVGRPSALITADREMLAWYFSQGWYIDAVLSRSQGGEWISVARASATQMANAMSRSEAWSSSEAASSGEGSTRATDTFTDTNGNVTVVGTGTSSKSEGSNSGSARSMGDSTNRGSSTSVTEQDGGPWWVSFQKLRLKRRRIQGEAVLQDMIESFTKAYNEGRTVNNDRYNELVTLYALMLSRTEDEANAFSLLSVEDFKPLAKMVTDAVKDALERYAASAENLPDDWLKSRIDEINRKFDALVGEAKSKMVSEGTYNSTVWPTTQAGIERQRQYALNDLKDDMVTLRVEVMGKIAGMTADVGGKLMDCEIRFIEAQKSMLLGPTEIRNNALKAMLEFMERRDDDYPGLDKIAEMAGTLGYAEGASQGAGGGE